MARKTGFIRNTCSILALLTGIGWLASTAVASMVMFSQWETIMWLDMVTKLGWLVPLGFLLLRYFVLS